MPRAPVCPFYGRVKREKLVCLRDGADTTGRGELCLEFPSQMCRVRYWVQHCCDDWETCSLVPALTVEYERNKDADSCGKCYNSVKTEPTKRKPARKKPKRSVRKSK